MTPAGLTPRAWFLVEYLDLAEATGDPEARWEAFQLQHLNNSALLGIARKCRQAGWSWLSAAESIAESVLQPRSTNVFVSVNLAEATEKIRYARHVIAALDRDVRPRLIIDNRLELELQNGSRLVSHPSRPPRGKAKANVYLDEFAHYPHDRSIYTAALPATTKGGRLRIGSSPLGAGGVFWEIYGQKLRTYPGFQRSSIPWWAVQALCRDVAGALLRAPQLPTEARVREFGTRRLIEIFENMPLEDFQQEYECAWVDEATAWITWEDIKRNQADAEAGQLWYRQARGVEAALRAIDEVAQAVKDGVIEPALAGGMDVGRKKDLTELAFVGRSTTGHLPYRLGISLSNTPFDDQKAVASKALSVLPLTKFLIDKNGLGMQIAEQLERAFAGRAQGVDFTNETKELWAVEMKVKLQRGHVPLPLERELSYQIHSIKKKITAAKNAVFDTVGNEQHHADKFWALALAVWGAAKTRTSSGIHV